jgi:hypothetical protein
MVARTARFTQIPVIPQSGLSSWQFQVLNAMKENIEILVGTKGNNAAITKNFVTVNPAPTQTMQRVTAGGVGFTVNGVNVPSIDDYVKLITDVQQLANDVAVLRNTVNILINQLKV